MDQKKRTEIASLGQFGLIDLLTSGFTPKNASTLKGAGDDAAVDRPGTRRSGALHDRTPSTKASTSTSPIFRSNTWVTRP